MDRPLSGTALGAAELVPEPPFKPEGTEDIDDFLLTFLEATIRLLLDTSFV